MGGFSDASKESRRRGVLEVGWDLEGVESSKGVLVLLVLMELLVVLDRLLDYEGGFVMGFWEFLSEDDGFVSSLRILKF